MKRNKFSRALKHLKKDLTEAPANSMSGVYSDNDPGFRLGTKDPERIFYPSSDGTWPDGIPGTSGEEVYVRPPGYWEEGPGTVPAQEWDTLIQSDFSYSTQADNSRNTDTIIDPTTGFVKASLPPNSRGFILGPLVDSYFHNHANDNQTRIGYIQKDTRELVILARIAGTWGNDDKGNPIPADGFEQRDNTRRWNGLESGFTAINENFTFEMLQWFYDRLKTGKYVQNASFFLAGGVGCVLGGGGAGQPAGTTQGNAAGGPTQGTGANAGNGGNGAGGPVAGQGGNPDTGSPQQGPQFGGPPDGPYPNPFGGGNPFGPGGLLGGLLGDLVDGLGDLGQYATNLLGALANQLGTGIPALDYSANIAKSILMNTPIEVNQADIPQDRIDKLTNNIPVNAIGIDIKVTSEPIPYSDENFYVDGNGKVNAHTPQTLQQYPNNTGPVAHMSKVEMGYVGQNNPLAAAGEAQAQVVIPPDGSEPYLLYTDHAYHNLKSSDPGEVPDPVKQAISDLVHSVKYSKPPKSDRYGEGSGGGIDTTTPNTGGMAGYPPNIRGDVKTEVKVPLTNLPPKVQEKVQFVTDYPTVYNDNPINQTKAESYKPKRLGMKTNKVDLKKQITKERRRKILREVKQPYVLPEVKKEKYKMNFSGKYKAQNTPDVTASKQSDDMMRAKNSAGQVWRTNDKYWSGYETTERMNVIQDRVGHGQWYFDSITNSNAQDYEKITERFKHALKDRKLQEHLNTLAHERAMRELEKDYVSPFRKNKKIEEQQTMQYDNDPLMKKVAKRLRTVIDYPDKPSPEGYPSEYPETPPSIPDRFNKLDPQSAEAMPATGDPKIDAKVEKARNLVKKRKK